MFESHFMPRETPESTDHSTKQVTTPMIAYSIQWLSSAITPSACRPALIWVTPRPSEVATPNTVPTSAITSIALPHPPRVAFSPMSGSSAQRTASGRPRRWMACASASPTTT